MLVFSVRYTNILNFNFNFNLIINKHTATLKRYHVRCIIYPNDPKWETHVQTCMMGNASQTFVYLAMEEYIVLKIIKIMHSMWVL